MSRSMTTDEIKAVAKELAAELAQREQVTNFEHLKQIASLENELRQARAQVEALTANNARLLTFVNSMTGGVGGAMAGLGVSPASAIPFASPAASSPFTSVYPPQG